MEEPFPKLTDHILNSLQDTVMGIGLDGKIMFANNAVVIYGYEPQELCNCDFIQLLPIGKKQEFESVLESVLFKEPVTPFETKRLTKAGEAIKISVLYSPIYDEQGKIKGISSMERKLSQHSNIEKKAEIKFKGLLESAPDAMVIVNDAGVVELVNAQTEVVFGYSKKELIGQRVEMLIPDKYKSHASHRKRFFINPKTRGMGSGMELLGKRKNGEEFPVEISLSPLKTSEGLLVSAAIRDISERKKLENMLKMANQDLELKVRQRTEEISKYAEDLKKEIIERKTAQNKIEQTNQELREFAYIISHDLKSPLRTFGSLSELLIIEYKDKLDAEGRIMLTAIKQRAVHMEKLIDSILHYSRIGSVEIKKETVDVHQLLREVINHLEVPSAFSIDIEGDFPVLYIEKMPLFQVFQNLIQNSIKYNDKPEGHISIGVTREKGQFKFNVSDNGKGIPEEHYEGVFHVFRTLNPGSQNSTGIGLSIVRKIINMYGGKIWIKSKVEKYTTFYFTLPEKWKELEINQDN